MLDTAEKFENAFERFDLYDGNFNSFLALMFVKMEVSQDICELDAYLKLCIASDDLDLSKMTSRKKEKFKKYWGTPEKMNKMIFIASVLDPRNKFVYVSFALEELLGEETGNVVNMKVEAYLRDLFEIYVSKYGKGSKSQPSSSDSSDSSASGISQKCPKIL
uniref:hAT-like transposase RNase-H fold domain-containing protein n=1 Tax=Solanum lycopersicum TaxID=4081 RepID=A0A3Q7HP74_SOLLC